MAQVINDPYSGNIFGRLGKGIGEGVSEQLPREMANYRESNAIEGLRNQKEPQDVLQQLSTLRRAGISGQEAAQYIPLIQQSQASKALKEKYKTQDLNAKEGPKERLKSTPEALEKAGYELHSNEPALYPTPQAGLAEATRRQENQQKELQGIKSAYQDALLLSTSANGAKVYADIPGEIQDKRIQKIEDAYISGEKTIPEAVREVAKQDLELAKARTTLGTVGAKDWFNKIISSPKKSKGQLDLIREDYKKAGEQELMAKDLINKNDLTPPTAYALTFPVSGDAKKFIDSKKQTFYGKNGFEKIGSKLGISKTSEKDIAKYFQKNAKDEDSPLAWASEVENIGLDKDEFLSKINEYWNENRINLNKRQQEEIKTTIPEKRTLSDVFYNGFLRQ